MEIEKLSNLKILFTMTPAFDPNAGGVQRTTYKLGRYFTEQGLKVSYYSLEHIGHVQVDYGLLYHAPEEGSNRNPKNITDLKRVLEEYRPDVVINQMPYEKELREVLASNKEKLDYILLGCLRNSLFNFKSNVQDRMQQLLPVTMFRLLNNPIGRGVLQFRHWITHRRDLKAIIDQHDFFILLAPPNRDELHYFIGDYKPDKILSIPNSIPSVHPESLNNKEKIILHVGRLNVQQKRSDLLLDFWGHTCHQLPDWRFVIVGDGPYVETLKEDLTRRKLPRVDLEGFQKPESYYEKSSVFMMPSAYEGFPNTIIEAQSYGCVPLAFNSYAALDWIVNHGIDAWLSEPYNTAQMAGQIISLINNGSIKQHQEKALLNAEQFTIERVGQQWLNLFNKLKHE